jgi:signal transduction histidine kinase
MSLLKTFFTGINVFFLVIPFSVTSVTAQFKIHSSEGTRAIGGLEASEKSSSETKGETWTRTYAPGEQERLYREAEQKEKWEAQEKAKEEAEARRAYEAREQRKLMDRALAVMAQQAADEEREAKRERNRIYNKAYNAGIDDAKAKQRVWER